MANYAAADNINLLEARVTDITLYKFGRKDKISIMPQFMEVNLYVSMFRSVMQAELIINDTISLHSNYPLVGEEIVEIDFDPTQNDLSDNRSLESFTDRLNSSPTLAIDLDPPVSKLTFVVTDVAQVYPDEKARSSIYSIKLYSPEYIENLKQGVMRKFDKGYHENAQLVLKDYLKTEARKIKAKNFEECKGVVPTVVPNMLPFPTIMWFAQRAVAKDEKHFNYMFYEDMEGFKFQTLQKLFDVGRQKRANEKKSFIYFSNALRDANLTERQQNSIKQATVTAIGFKKRYSTQEKYAGGFYENEYFEIDLLNLRVNSTVTKAKDVPTGTLSRAQINTPDYIKAAQTPNGNPGDYTRTRYIIGHGGGDQPSAENYWKDKFGEAARAYASLSQVQIVVTVPGDTRVNPGDVIHLEVPEFHGFNDTKIDPYIGGDYIVTDMKHTISVGMQHVMVLNLARDSYEKTIETKHNYNLNV